MSHAEDGKEAEGGPHEEMSIESVAVVIEAGTLDRYVAVVSAGSSHETKHQRTPQNQMLEKEDMRG